MEAPGIRPQIMMMMMTVTQGTKSPTSLAVTDLVQLSTLSLLNSAQLTRKPPVRRCREGRTC